ncbi:MAG TPA: VCBS repeat-containing protein [Phycisphaerae bacterium]|nr:VCBS repeat-containing protein [Phycisphaerae bacterium]HNU43849.1 VCBS repeat-containing protein [Phycisphaerae bacterium]
MAQRTLAGVVGVVVMGIAGGGTGSAAFGQLQLSGEQFVTADGAPIVVPGYSVPSLADWNNDGLLDLIIGEGGDGITPLVRVYLNVGTASDPQFSGFFYAQTQSGDLTVPTLGCLGIFPRVVQWDGDGRKDLLAGLADGTVQVFLNINTDADPLFDDGTFLEVGLPGSKVNIDIGARATPIAVDWNLDGRKDLVVGGVDGRIHVFLNEGTDTAPDFRAQTYAQAHGAELFLVGGRSSPVFMDFDGDGKRDLLSGDTTGELVFYANTGTDAAPSFGDFELVRSLGVVITLPDYERTRPFVGDWDNDGQFDVIVGYGDGKVRHYRDLQGLCDFDSDRDVDVNDYAAFEGCLGGPDVPIGGCSLGPDLDEDGDIDLHDVALFQILFTGE